jgi:predicted nucleic acid-binding protein
MLYLDASALVKRYVTEDGSDAVLEAMDRVEPVSMCRVGFVETKRAIARAGDPADLERFESDWHAFEVVEVDAPLSERAAELACTSGLRSLDAIHLAAALALPRRALTFATWDARLHRAAREHGLETLPATLG